MWYGRNIFIFITVAVYSPKTFVAINVVILKHDVETQKCRLLVHKSSTLYILFELIFSVMGGKKIK